MQPHFGIVGIHKSDEIFDVTGMNPNSEQLTSFITGIFRDTKYISDLIALISEHMLRP